MKPFDYFKNVYTKNYANFKGRARRSEYWYTILFFYIIYFVLGMLGSFLAGAIGEGTIAGLLMLPAGIFALASIVPLIAVSARRMHDVGKSGWFMLIPLYSLYLSVTDSEEGSNQYGPNPKSEGIELEDNLVK